MLGDRPALMMDKTVNGMDPEGIMRIRGLLRSPTAAAMLAGGLLLWRRDA